MIELEDLRLRLRDFAAARDWQEFHTPKNLAMALVAEAAEVVEHFQWLTASESQALDPAKRADVGLELADVLLYLLMLADSLDINLADVAHRKIELNEERFPPSSVPQERL
jgi:dCTP diphosphatase